jgi:rhomboid protease GluP
VEDDTDWVEVYASPAPAACNERALVLLAVGIPAVMRARIGAVQLLVSPDDAVRASQELDSYRQENRPRARAVPPRLHSGALLAAAGYALVLFICSVASTRSLFHFDWYDAGVLDGVAVRAGQWWRALTALTLHADLGHLTANAGFGALFGVLVARVYGGGAGWLLVLAAATVANLLNAAWMPAGRVSIGASTAVFAALGALAVHRWPASTRLARAGLRGGSIVAALVLLALLGTGDANTDIAAHALGFASGALLAVPLRRFPPRRGRVQWVLGAAAVLLIAAAWAVALGASVAGGRAATG